MPFDRAAALRELDSSIKAQHALCTALGIPMASLILIGGVLSAYCVDQEDMRSLCERVLREYAPTPEGATLN